MVVGLGLQACLRPRLAGLPQTVVQAMAHRPRLAGLPRVTSRFRLEVLLPPMQLVSEGVTGLVKIIMIEIMSYTS